MQSFRRDKQGLKKMQETTLLASTNKNIDTVTNFFAPGMTIRDGNLE